MDAPKRKIIPKRALVGLLFVVGFFLIIIAFALSPVFVLKNVKISGNYFLTEEEVFRISGVEPGENLFQIEMDDVIQTMSKDIRIEKAIVKRVFPSTIEIQVIERPVLAMVQCDYGFLEVGTGGTILAAHRNLTNVPVPLITGVTVSDLFVGDVVENANINAVINYIALLDSETEKNLSEINIADPENVVVYMKGPVQLKMGDISSLAKKLEITESVSREVSQGKHKMDYVDARFDGTYSIRLKQ